MTRDVVDELLTEITAKGSSHLITVDGLTDDVMGRLVRSLEENGYQVFVLDREGCLRDRESLFEALRRECGFPAYFGGNWDAVYDCLTDLGDWITEADGYVLILTQSNPPLSNSEECERFWEILKAVGEWWEENDEIPFKSIVPDMDDTRCT